MRGCWTIPLVLLVACSEAPRGEIPPPVQVDSTGAAVVSAIAPAPDTATPAEPLTLRDRTWVLVALGDGSTPPAGAAGRQATLRLESSGDGTRFAGFAGCNRYSGTYRLAGDSLRFGAMALTKMACPDGEALERVMMGLLPRVQAYALSDTALTLSGFGAPLAHLTPQAPRGRAAVELAR